MRPGALACGLLALVLLGLTAWCLVRGVDVRASTGGLLTAPVRQVRLHGEWLVAATAAGIAAILIGLEGVVRFVRSR